MSIVRSVVAVAITLSVCLPAAAQEPAAGDPAITSGGFTYRLGVGYMFQASARQDYAFRDDQFRDDETFAWWRLRPRFAATSRHVDVVLEGQDTHGAGGSFASRKGWLDVLNAYVEVRGSRGWSARAGRQQGDLEVIGRLVRQADFVAVLRTIDVATVSYRNASTDVRGFVFKPVDSLPSSFNRQREGEVLWSAYGRRRLAERAAVQSYVVARHNRDVLSETGAPGDAAVYAWQVQVEGPTPYPAVDWVVETVLERGHYSADAVRAWAVFLRSDIRVSPTSTVDVRYTVTSPDVAKGDGVRAQFDQIYGPATYFGFLGQTRGSNVRAFSVGGATRLRPRLTLNWRYFATALHDRRDLWYGAVSPNLANPGAASTFLGHEIGGLLSFQATPKMLIRGGYFQFVRGGYVPDRVGHPREIRVQVIGTL